jgi:hypothetical protein
MLINYFFGQLFSKINKRGYVYNPGLRTMAAMMLKLMPAIPNLNKHSNDYPNFENN